MFNTVDEARAAFRADRAMLEERGVMLPYSMQRYLTEREKRNGVLAMDATGQNGLPGPLSTDPTAALPWMLTSAIDPEIIRVLFSPLEFAEILGERKAGVWTEQTRFFPIVESTGEVTSYDDYATGGRAGANFNYPQLQSYLFQTVLQYGELQIDRAGLAKINWVSELGLAAAELLTRFQNITYAYGVQNLQNYGILNSPYISASLTPATKAWGGTGWFDNGSPAATANEVYNDILAVVEQIIVQTNGAVEKADPMTLALSPASNLATAFTNSFGVSVADLLKKGFPNMKIATAPQYGQKTISNNQGYNPTGNVFQVIVDKIDGQKVAYPAFNEKLRAHKLIPEPSSWKQKMTSGVWGTITRMPMGISGMIGI